MSQPQPDGKPDASAVDLRALAPRQEWVSGLAQLGRDAALRRSERASWTAAAGRAGRWFLPAAAALALACWWLAARRAPANTAPPLAAALVAGSEREVLQAVTLEARP